jgi:hypothetical protein
VIIRERTSSSQRRGTDSRRKLVEVRHVEPSFETEKAAIVELIKGEQLAKLRAETERQLRARALVTIAP